MFDPLFSRRLRCALVAILIVGAACTLGSRADDAAPAAATAADAPFTLVVMDPLALPLSCPCVQGYAQRDYNVLAEELKTSLGREVKVVFAESLAAALKGDAKEGAHLIIGKRSVVEFDAKRCEVNVTAVASLTGKDGETTQTGLIVVPKDDPAQSVSELKGYRLIFGPAECDEKNAAAIELLKEHGVEIPAELETAVACDEGATKILEAGAEARGAAIISSYAKPLLEGCGSVPKGALRVVGETKAVPFVVAFTTDKLPKADRKKATAALMAIGKNAKLLAALETQRGFVPLEKEKPRGKPGKKPVSAKDSAWNGWRGPHRDGVAGWLPERLPEQAKVEWTMPLGGQGLAGVAANDRIVVVADRDGGDQFDVFHCFDARSGIERWSLRYEAAGKLDYGNSPRATPLIHGGRVYTLGAFGHLHCVEAATGRVLWKRSLPADFGAKDDRPWGASTSPLIVAGKLIVNPGAEQASLAALDPKNGRVLWTTPGGRAAYGSFIAGEFGGREQLVGYDETSLGGWDVATGERLWTLTPPRPNDFNVPTPVAIDGRLLVTTENNGTRLYDFDDRGCIVSAPAAVFRDLAPDCHTPVALGGRLYGVSDKLYCLDVANGLAPVWTNDAPAFASYTSIIAAPNRILATTHGGELYLFDAGSMSGEPLSVLRPVDEPEGIYAHPAIAGDRLYLRGSRAVYCVNLGA